MAGVWQSWGHVVVAALLAVPVAALVVVALARLRAPNAADRPAAWRRSLAEVLAVAGTAPWLWMVLTPKTGDRAVSLVPLRDLLELLGARPVTIAVQLTGNLLVLAAFGAALPVRFAAMTGLARVAVAAASASASIELAQYALHLGRVTSVDDVLVNTAGAVLGALLSRRWWESPQVIRETGGTHRMLR
ncbi:VanZ family protein [Saccharopolyspora erythraea]|uniref:VanZ family protein n=1 Tax=Saccharopolyspora erythraea TaxID=1836 RepID=UPI00201150DE|nr:VanZ family protein [Saccharopolyspora erythraea]